MRYQFNFRSATTCVHGIGDSSMAEEDEKKSKERPKKEDERGALLHVFRPTGFKKQRILLFVIIAVFVWMIVDFTRIILRYTKEESKVPILLTFYLIVLFFTYIYYLIVFDNIGIYERGITPPLSKEKRLWRTLPMFRTFISFKEISNFEIIDRPEPFTGLIFKALGRHWIFSSNWDIFTFIMVLEQGMANRYILDFELEEIVKIHESVVDMEEDTITVPEVHGAQEQPSVKQGTQ